MANKMTLLAKKHPKIGSEIILVPANSLNIEISHDYDLWTAKRPLLSVPYYFKIKATILDVKSKIIGRSELARYQIKFKFRGQQYIGWIHDLNALICAN